MVGSGLKHHEAHKVWKHLKKNQDRLFFNRSVTILQNRGLVHSTFFLMGMNKEESSEKTKSHD